MLKVNQLRAKKEKLKRWLKGWFSLSCLLGVQWVIGYVYVDGSNVFDYIFTAFNCSQGILIFVFHCVLRTRTRQILLGRSTQSKSSMMMNSVYGQITLAQRKDRQSRQSRISRDTSITTLSSRSRPTTASSDTPDSSPASERSQSSCSSSGSLKGRLLRRSTARHARSSVTSQLSVRGGPAPDQLQPTSSLRGRVNLAFQLEEPLPDITEEAEQSSPPILLPPDDSLTCHLPAPRRTNRADVHRSHSTATCRRGHLY